MSDLVSLVLGIPGTVEGFVKTCRALEQYKNVEQKHKQTIADAILYSEKLKYYSNFIDLSSRNTPQNSPDTKLSPTHDSQPDVGAADASVLMESEKLLVQIFENSLVSLSSARKVVDEWTFRLGLNVDDQSNSRMLIARVALAISDRLTGKDHSTGQREKNNPLYKFRGKIALLVIGCQQIDDAMGRLKHCLRELHDILMVSPALRRRLSPLESNHLQYSGSAKEDIVFVSMALERKDSTRTMETIKPELISSLRPLDDRKTHTLMLVDSKDSPYHGCLVDRRNILHLLGADKEDQAVNDTELIARLFAEERDSLGREISASVGVLPCCGFSRPIRQHHDLVFRIPDNTRRPRTLRSMLLEGTPRHSLNDRLDFSIKLATSVLIVHSLRILHKDIRPDSIIVLDRMETLFKAPGAQQTLGEPYLVSFNESRSLDSATVPLTMSQYEEVRWATLYTHPRHLASYQHRPYEMRDDIYSLGICLLEVGIWRSLFSWDATQNVYINDTSVCDVSEERYDKMLEEMGEDSNRSQSWLRQYDLVQYAEEKVAVAMGNGYRDVVVECLTFGMGKKSLAEIIEEKNLDQIHLQKSQSIEFINKILSKLRSLKLT